MCLYTMDISSRQWYFRHQDTTVDLMNVRIMILTIDRKDLCWKEKKEEVITVTLSWIFFSNDYEKINRVDYSSVPYLFTMEKMDLICLTIHMQRLSIIYILPRNISFLSILDIQFIKRIKIRSTTWIWKLNFFISRVMFLRSRRDAKFKECIKKKMICKNTHGTSLVIFFLVIDVSRYFFHVISRHFTYRRRDDSITLIDRRHILQIMTWRASDCCQ